MLWSIVAGPLVNVMLVPVTVIAYYLVRGALFVEAADGGPAPLTHSYQVYGGTTSEIRALVTGVDYVFAVDAVNSNGVTVGTAQVAAAWARGEVEAAEAAWLEALWAA